VLRDAVTATPQRDIRRAGRLSNLGSTLKMRYDRTGSARDLDDAIAALQQAADAAPGGHLDRIGALSNLGGALLTRFRLTAIAGDLDDAIAALSHALDAETTPTGPLDRARALLNLGAAIMERLKSTGTTGDLDVALNHLRQAVEALTDDHPTRAVCLLNLGNALYISYKLTGKEADLDAAINSQRAAYEMKTAAPIVRGRAAQRWGRWALDEAGDRSAAVEGYSAAVGMLPLIAWHGLDQATREEALSNWAGLAADAAASAIADGQPERAVELLEQGRSLLWTQALQIRTDLSLLRKAAPELAAQLEQARQELDGEMPATPITADPAGVDLDLSGQSQEWARERRRRAATLWDKTLEKVWEIKDFEYFLRPRPFSEFRKAAVGGPVVIVNVSVHGCHAVIISDKETVVDSTGESATSTGVQVENLPELTVDAVVGRMNSLLDVQSRLRDGERPDLEQARDQNIASELLKWLWNTVAQPVLKALGHAGQPVTGKPLPRLWWCPTRELVTLPIHAAGNCDGGSQQAVYGHVISSYTPTLSELIRARRPYTPMPARQLAIGMTTTPGQEPLPSVKDELAVLSSYFPEPDRAQHLRDEKATRAAAMHAIGEYPWIHLACHARQDQSDPSRSAFLLYDGPLTISELAAVRTENAELAYLAGCHTFTGSIGLLDEAIHLAAAMQLAGYRHVIATMWSIKDPPSPELAYKIYRALTQTGQPDPAECATALHTAVGRLRNRFPHEPLTWAPYVHIGP